MSTVDYTGKTAVELMRAEARSVAAAGNFLLRQAADPMHFERKAEYENMGNSLLERAEVLNRWADIDESRLIALARDRGEIS